MLACLYSMTWSGQLGINYCTVAPRSLERGNVELAAYCMGAWDKTAWTARSLTDWSKDMYTAITGADYVVLLYSVVYVCKLVQLVFRFTKYYQKTSCTFLAQVSSILSKTLNKVFGDHMIFKINVKDLVAYPSYIM